MELRSRHTGEVQVITVESRRIDAAAAIRFKDLMRAETASGGGRVILDLEQVDFVDSSGLGAIVAAMKQLAPERTLDLSGLRPDVEKVFRLTRMDTVFTIHANLGEAVASRAAG